MAENPTAQPTPTQSPTPTRSTGPVTQADGQTASTFAGDTDFEDIATTMQQTKAAQVGGTYGQLVAEVAPQVEPEPMPEMDLSNAQVVLPVGGSLPAAMRPAAMADTPPPPGMTPRGWSTEVTARHPELMAQAMEELAAQGDISPRGTDPIDPLDAQALAFAQNALGSIEVFKNNLRNRAAELNGERLGAAKDKLATAGEAVKLAVQEALEEAQAAADLLKERGQAARTSHQERRTTRETTRDTTREAKK